MPISKPHVSTIFPSLISAWFTYFIHEVFHWLGYTYFKIKTLFKLNTIELLDQSQFISDSKLLIIQGAGVFITFFQALCCYLFLRKTKNIWLNALLISAFELRFLAGILNFLNPSDEGKMSLILNLPKHTISVIVISVMGGFIYQIIITNKPPKKEFLSTLLFVFISLYIFSLISI